MLQSKRLQIWQLLKTISCLSLQFVSIGVLLSLVDVPTSAQITPDNSLGAEQSRLLPDNSIEGGARRGQNLFHSFQDFNVAEGQQVYFVGDFGIRNIISRVTGTSPSTIRGTLGVSNFSANLFLINPNGIVIGPNARLDIFGSFVATTASAIQFGNQGFFSAINPTTPPLLTVNPSALLFNQMARSRPALISVKSSGLDGFVGTSLLLLGGDVSLENSQLNILAGRIELGGLSTTGAIELKVDDDILGKVSANFPANVARSDLEIVGSQLSTAIPNESFNFGGDIALHAHNITIAGNELLRSYLLTGIANLVQTVDGRGGNIRLDATGTLTIADATVSSGAQFRAIGNSGAIDVIADSLILKDSGQIDSLNAGVGTGGPINIQANSVVVDGTPYRGLSSAISSSLLGSIPASPDAGIGQGGDITIKTRSLKLINGGVIESIAAFGAQGSAGNVTITAQDAVEIDGTIQLGFSAERVASGILTSLSDESIGRGGNISITSRSLSLTNGGILQTSSSAQGNAGNVVLTTQTATLDGNNSGIFSSLGANAIGTGGTINLAANTVTISNHARISAETQGQGDAGNVSLNANFLDLTSGGQVRTATATTGAAGDIRLKVRDRINITGMDSGLFANTSAGSDGNGGTIFVDSNTLTLQDFASISVDSQGTGTGGNIKIQANLLQLSDRALISAETASNTGGNIALDVSGLLFLRRNSSISTTAGKAQGGGNGGDINLSAGFIIAVPTENSDITANAFEGRGGNITITTQGIFGIAFRDRLTPLSDITASSQLGVDGVVNITTLRVDPTQGTFELPTTFSTPPLAQGCGVPNSQTSRFVSTGRGGVPSNPVAPITAGTIWQDLEPLEDKDMRQRGDVSTHSSISSIAQPWRLEAEVEQILLDGAIALSMKTPIVIPLETRCHIAP